MNKLFNCSVIILIAFFSVSCGTPDRKTGERSTAHKGKAVITEITASKDDSAAADSGYMDIYFKFIPSDPSAAEKYLCPECPDGRVKLFYDNRNSFHKNWIDRWEIKPGSEYPALRHELLRKDNAPAVSYEVLLEPKKQD